MRRLIMSMLTLGLFLNTMGGAHAMPWGIVSDRVNTADSNGLTVTPEVTDGLPRAVDISGCEAVLTKSHACVFAMKLAGNAAAIAAGTLACLGLGAGIEWVAWTAFVTDPINNGLAAMIAAPFGVVAMFLPFLLQDEIPLVTYQSEFENGLRIFLDESKLTDRQLNNLFDGLLQNPQTRPLVLKSAKRLFLGLISLNREMAAHVLKNAVRKIAAQTSNGKLDRLVEKMSTCLGEIQNVWPLSRRTEYAQRCL